MAYDDYQENLDRIIGCIENTLEEQGWFQDNGEWTVNLILDDISPYISEKILDQLMEEGNRVYGRGPEAVATFIEECYVSSEFEENLENLGISEEDLDLLDEDEELFEEVSSFIQGQIRPSVDLGALCDCLRGWGYDV